jgi:hypothetical protein
VSEEPQVILDLPEKFEPVRHIRSTLLMSSYASVRDAGYEAAYRAALPPTHHRAIFEAVAGTWIPIEVAVAHYLACGTLGLSHDTQLALGRIAGEKIHGTILGTVVRMAKASGVSPWAVISQFQRFWNRAFDGGGILVVKTGPKEAHLEIHKAANADCPYWRAALCGLAMGVLELFCRKAYMQETTKKRAPGYATFRVQWA